MYNVLVRKKNSKIYIFFKDTNFLKIRFFRKSINQNFNIKNESIVIGVYFPLCAFLYFTNVLQ